MNARAELLPRSTVHAICGARSAALAKMGEAIEELTTAYRTMGDAREIATAAHYGASYYVHERSEANALKALDGSTFDPAASLEAYRKELDCRVWTHLLNATGMKQMMDRQSREELDRSLRSDVIEATEENVRATLERLLMDSDLIFRRGLANAFSGLDRRFKSHNGFKIGARMIIPHAASCDGYLGYDGVWHTIADVERVMAVLDGEQPDSAGLRNAVSADRTGWGPRQSETESRYFRIRIFKNGNAHLWFTRDDLVEKANKLLAEHYGEVLPDAYDEGDGSELFGRSTAVSKDLQFYRSPDPVVEELIDDLWLDGRTRLERDQPLARVLEPSAGDGAIALAAARRGARVRAIEVEQDRADLMSARAQRIEGPGRVTVERANFLKVKPEPVFDFVLMNPPFYGTHYMDHVRHAWEFLAPGGILRAVLPASAEVNEGKRHDAFRKWANANGDYGWRGAFKELPAESFAESGTRIQTVILMMRKR